MKTLLRLFATLALLVPLGSCIIVSDDNCDEGSVRCDGEIIEECVGGDWDLVEDCWALCGGTCDFDAYGNPVCLC